MDPKTRQVSDVRHEIVAVGSSTSASRAESFVQEHCSSSKGIKTYGSYVDFLKDEVSPSYSPPSVYLPPSAPVESQLTLHLGACDVSRTFKQSTSALLTVSIGPTPATAFWLESQSWALLEAGG